MTPEQIQAAFDRRTMERIPPEYHGREDCLWRPDYSRPVERPPWGHKIWEVKPHNRAYVDQGNREREQLRELARQESRRLAAEIAYCETICEPPADDEMNLSAAQLIKALEEKWNFRK